ncbi:MAG: InlB B-repeat-containing protein, partial [Clostridia bacterium]|nr:InlB B-repeat-containing protein [Clostridia bacterium]
MRNIELNPNSKLFVLHILPIVLAVIMMFGSLAELTVWAVANNNDATETNNSTESESKVNDYTYVYDAISIYCDGEQIDVLHLNANDKKNVIAKGSDVYSEYQWQILHPEKNGLWIDIYEAKSLDIDVSLALIGNILNDEGAASIRCCGYYGEYAYVSNILTVYIADEEIKVENPVQYAEPKVNEVSPISDGDDDNHPEFVTVTIQYEKYGYFYNVNTSKYELQYIAPAFSSYIATLQYGKQFKPVDPISVPTVVGYKPIFEGTADIVMLDGKIYADVASVTSNITLEVRYVPDSVGFEVLYLFQNIYDDMYVTDTSINDDERGIVNGTYHGEGITGLPPSYKIDADGNPYDSDEKIGISAEFDGFTALYYQPDTIAADGSTVFEVYFERNYYLMEFDCDGGYGAHTIYARHGTYIYVPAPAKMGYVLDTDSNGNYWDLVKTEDPKNTEALGTPLVDQNGNPTGFYTGDKNPNALPAVMPKYHSAYKALWETTDTTYTVVYWIDNGDGTNTYLGSRPVNATSATTVHGTNDLTTSMNICGLEAHTHGAGCTYSCGKTEHTHGDGCCNITPHIHDGTDCEYDCNAINHDHSSGCVYCNLTEHTHGRDCYTFTLQVSTSATTLARPTYRETTNGFDIYRDGSSGNYVLINGSYYYISSYKKNNFNGSLTCNTAEHTHSSACCTVKPHIHTADCTCIKVEHTHNHGTGSTCNYTCGLTNHNHATSGCRLSCGKEEHAHSANCKYSDVAYLNYLDAKTDKNIVVEGDGSSVVNVYYEYKTYNFKFYYAKEENSKYYVCGNTTAFANGNSLTDQLGNVSGNWGQVKALPTLTNTADIDVSIYTLGYDELTVSGTKGKYYYFTISFKYNEDISKKWPVGIFNDAETATTFDFGNYASFSAWNVDSNTWYDINNTNKTLKGNYQRLDYKLLIENNPNDTELNYLAFWENGTTGLGWNKAHRWTYNVYIPDANGTYQRSNDMTYRVESGQSLPDSSTKYSLYGSYKVYDNNGASSGSAYCEQTPTALEGYELCFYGAKDLGVYNSTYNLHNYQIDFYYVANGPYQLSMYNYNAVMSDQGSDNLYFGTSLSPYEISEADMRNLYYPKGIEPGAYEFGGWYTTPACYDGTEVNWNTLTMPDGNLTLYAKWTPIKRNVYFHLLYTDINYDDLENSNFWYPDGLSDAEKEGYYPIEVSHGELLGTTYSHTPTRVVNGEEYTFIGWFYFDENGKKKFAPDSMKV